MKKVRYINLGFVLLAFSVLWGCGNQEKEAKKEAETEKIVIWAYYETDAQNKAMDDLVSGFNLYSDNFEASWEYVPMTEFTKKLSMAYTEKSLPDLALIDNPDMPACIKMGMFEDITEFLKGLKIEDNYYPALLQTVTYEGRMYGLPFNCSNVALIYNKQLLREKGLEPPGTWEELEYAAAALTTPQRSGFLMSSVEGEQGAFQILPWILSTGERINDIGGEKTTEAFTFIHNLMEKEYMTRNCINLSQTDVARIFVQGEVAMMENGPWVFPMLKEAGIDFGVSRLPISEKSSVIVGGENLGILKGKNLAGAKEFLTYYNQDHIMKKFCNNTGVLPTKKNIPVPGDSDMVVFQEQMDGAVVRTTIPSWNTLASQLSDAMYQLAANEKTPEEAAKALKAE